MMRVHHMLLAVLAGVPAVQAFLSPANSLSGLALRPAAVAVITFLVEGPLN